jgi:hypothetical protein
VGKLTGHQFHGGSRSPEEPRVTLGVSDGQVDAKRAVIRAFCVVVLLSFAVGKVSAQIGPVIDALPSDRLFVACITASISGNDRMTRH